MTLLAQSSPSCVIRTLTVPDCRADTALSVTALLIAAAAFSTPRVPPDEPPTTKTATVAAAARATPAAEKPTRVRPGRTCRTRGSSAALAVAIRKRTSAVAASTVSAKFVLLRGLALRRASKLSDVFMNLLQVRA